MPEKSGLVRCLTALVLAMPLYFPSGTAGGAIAGERLPIQPLSEPQTMPAATPAKSKEPDPVKTFINDDTTEAKKDVDTVHDRLEQGILGEIISLDNFFGNPKMGDEGKTEYQLHLRNSVRVALNGNLKYGASIRANVTLSKISERLRLYIAGDNTPETLAPRLPEDPGNPGFDRPSVTAKIANTELRFWFLQTPSTNMFLGAGFKLVIPPEAFIRSRIQHTHYISDVALLRFGETLFANNVLGLGETSEIDAERMLAPKTLLRLSVAGTVSHKVQGVEWGTELALMHQLSSKSSITLAGGVDGNTSLDDLTGRYWLLTRYRRNFLRSWLYYELVPEITWPRQADGRFPVNYAMSFILEVAFKGSTNVRKNKPGNP